MVAVGRLDHHGQADALGGFPGFVGGFHRLACGHGHARGAQQLLGQVLVAGNALGDGAGAVGLGRPDAALGGALAQLDQIAFVQAQGGDRALSRRIHDTGGTGAQAAAIHQIAQLGHDGRQVVGQVVDGGHDQVTRRFQRQAAHHLVAGADHHFVNAGLLRHAGLAKAGFHAGLGLQLQRDVFHDVAGPGAVAQAHQETAAAAHAAAVLDQAWQPSGQALVEAGQGVGGEVLQRADVDHGFDHGAVRPDVGAAQMRHAADHDVGEGAGRLGSACVGSNVGRDRQWPRIQSATAGGATLFLIDSPHWECARFPCKFW